MSAQNLQKDAQPEIFKYSQCSCDECDSRNCFTKRRQDTKKCSCEKCNSSKTCLYYNNKITHVDESRSEISNIQLKSNNSNLTDNCITERTNKLPNSSIDKNKCNEPPEIVTNESFENEIYIDKKANKKFITQSHSKYSYKIIPSCHSTKEESSQAKNSELSSIRNNSIPCCRSDIRPSTAKLSAQIMNVPYNDFRESLLFKRPDNAVKSKTILSKFDILNRIKEAYKACSCKVCECIPSLPLMTDVCQCKPCECDDCRNIKDKLPNVKNSRFHSKSCACILCATKEDSGYKFISSKAESCNCKPCECVECVKSVSRDCDCEPCQCNDCKLMAFHKTLIVAPVGEDNPRAAVCSCSPCECMECGNAYGTIGTHRTHEMATGTNRPRNCRCEACLNEVCDLEGNDVCRCGEDKVVRKPVLKDSNDYDIRRALISNIKPRGESSTDKYNTIAMFATLPNTCLGFMSKSSTSAKGFVPVASTSNGCGCTECESVEYKYKDHENAYKKSQEISFTKKDLEVPVNTAYCKCSPCECEICIARGNQDCFVRENNCECDSCGFVNCENYTMPSCSTKENILMNRPIIMSPDGICKYLPCEYMNCQKLIIKSTGDFCQCNRCECESCLAKPSVNESVDPNKDGCLMKHSNHDNFQLDLKLGDMLGNEDYSAKKYSMNKSDHSPISKNSGQDIFIYAYPQHDSSYMDHSAKNAIDPTHILNTQSTKNIDNSECKIKKSNSEKSKEIKCQVSDSFISAMSSHDTSKLSYMNGSDSISLVSAKKHAPRSSVQSSCNSSGHDYSDYLIRFPRTTAETCITDVMKLNLDNKLILNSLNISSMANTEDDYIQQLQCSRNSQDMQCHKTKMAVIPNSDIYEVKRHTGPNSICNSRNTCECNHCECEKCMFRKLKPKRCDCDCAACSCFGGCFNENESIFIKKNEETQTRKSNLQDRGQDCSDRNDNSSVRQRFERNFIKLNTELYPLLPNKKEFEVTKDIDRATINYANYISSGNNITGSEECSPWNFGNRSLDSYKNNISILPIQINYNSVHNTIREARQFSKELLEILEKYEKANREFESVSQRVKFSQESLTNSNILHKNTKDVSYVDKPNVVKENTWEKLQENDSNNENKPHYLEEKYKLNKTDHTQNVVNINTEGDTPHLGMMTKDFDTLEQDDVTSDITTILDAVSTEKTDIKSFSSFIFDEVCKKIFQNSEDKEFKNRYKKYRTLIKRAVAVSRRFDSKPNEVQSNITHDTVATTGELTDLRISAEEIGRNDVIDTQEHNICNISEDMRYLSIEHDTSESRENIDSQGMNNLIINNANENELSTEVQEIKSDEINSVLKKNLCLDIETHAKRKVAFPSVEKDVKETVQFISMQLTNYNGGGKKDYVPTFGNKALANLRLEVNKLLNMPQLQSLTEANRQSDSIASAETTTVDLDIVQALRGEASQTNYDVRFTANKEESPLQSEKIQSQVRLQRHLEDYANIPPLPAPPKPCTSKLTDHENNGINPQTSISTTSCDGMKVSFYGVRRVSDHTILVKWNPPQDTKDIQGYELLVDGRAVQKILSPTRCMAVITCLPHNDKVLLTIRTITAVAHGGYYPATTIVYHPRIK